jgi:hypothetical protein
MWWMVGFEAGISASVDGFSVDFGDQCHLFSDDQNIQVWNHTIWLYFHSELAEKP